MKNNKDIARKLALIGEKLSEKEKRKDLSALKAEIAEVVKRATPIKGKDYFDGYTPVKGKDYDDGKDGYTPIKGKDYFDGKDGYTPKKGVDYRDGYDGKTPKKGEDYFTEAEVKSIIDLAMAGFKITSEQVVKLLSDPNIPYEKRLSVLVLKDLNKLNLGGNIGGTATQPSASTFLALTDTPATYVGAGSKGVRVNAGETALEFYTVVDTDEKVKYDAGDPTAGYIASKFIAGAGISLSEGTGADENKLKITSSITQYTDALAVTAIKADSAWHATNWDTAYGWGNHASAGYLTSATADSNYLKLNQGTPQTVTGGMPTFAGGLLAGDKLMFTQTDGNEYIDSLNDGYLDIGATTAIRMKGITLATDKISFTQTDNNEYIDSLADGYMDYGATTEHRFRIGATQPVGIKSGRAWFDAYTWFGATDTAGGYDSNWKTSFFGNSSWGYTARFTNLGSTDRVMFKTSTSNNSNGALFGADKIDGQKFAYMDSAVGGGESGQVRALCNSNLTTMVASGFYGNHTADDSSGAKTQIHGDATAIYENYYAGDPTDNGSYVDNSTGSYSYRTVEYYIYQYKSYTIGEDTVVVWSASPMYFYADGNSESQFQVQLAWTLNGEYDGAVVHNTTDGYYIDVGGASSQVDDGSYSGWTSGSPDIQNQSPYQVQTGSEYGVSANFKGAVMLSAQATPASPVNNTFWIGTDNLMHAYINDVEYTLDMTAV